MVADVAKSGGSEQSVGDRVEHDVGIAVPGEPSAVRHFDPAEHHRALAREDMDVEAHARARDKPAGEPLFGAFEVGGKS